MRWLDRGRRRAGALAWMAAAMPVAWLCLHEHPAVAVVKKAAGIPESAEGVGRFINGAHALVLPALVMTAAVAPLALIAGRPRAALRRPARHADHRHVAGGAVAAGQRHRPGGLTGAQLAARLTRPPAATPPRADGATATPVVVAPTRRAVAGGHAAR